MDNKNLPDSCIGRPQTFVALLLATAIVASPPILAVGPVGNDATTQHENTPLARSGFNSEDVFQNIGGTEVNAFNFNFTMAFSVATGLSYPQNAGLSLAPARFYNSNVSNAVFVGCANKKSLRYRRDNPMGLGFEFSFGRVIKAINSDKVSACEQPPLPRHTEYNWTYISPDGARSTLQLGSSGSGYRTYYSHDGTHIRATESVDVFDNTTGWTLEFPDGTVRVMDEDVPGPMKLDLATCCNPSQGCPAYVDTLHVVPDADFASDEIDRDWLGWHTTEIYTKAATATDFSYKIIYHDNVIYSGDSYRLDHIPQFIDDQHGRRITVEVEDDPTNAEFGLIKRIEVPAPQDGAGNARTADYLFYYDFLSGTYPEGDIETWLLTRVEGPDLGGGERYAHVYEYTGWRIGKIHYPSGRLESFTYQSYPFLARGDGIGACNDTNGNGICDPGESRGNPCECTLVPTPGEVSSSKLGLASKTVYVDGDESNTAPENMLQWTYSQVALLLDNEEEFTCETQQTSSCSDAMPLYEQLHILVDPAGNTSTKRFNTPVSPLDPDFPDSPPQAPVSGYGDLLEESFYEGAFDEADPENTSHALVKRM